MQIRDQLQIYFDHAYKLSHDEQAFFLATLDYVRYVSNYPYLTDLVREKLHPERDKLIDQRDSLANRVINESENCYNDLQVILKSVKSMAPDLQEALDHFKALLEGRLQTGSPYAEAMYRQVGQIINAIDLTPSKSNIDHLVNRYDNGHISDWSFSPTFSKYKSLLEKIDFAKDTSIWGHWNELQLLYETIQFGDEIAEKFQQDKKMLDYMNFIGLLGEIRTIIRPERNRQKREPIFFVKESFELYLLRFHGYLLQLIGEDPPDESSETKIETTLVDPPQFTGSEQVMLPDPELFQCGPVKLNLTAATLQYKENDPVDISIGRIEIRFFTMLLRASPNVVHYPKLSKDLELPDSDDEYHMTMARPIQDVKNKLGILLKDFGVTKQEYKEMVKCVPKQGYKIPVSMTNKMR